MRFTALLTAATLTLGLAACSHPGESHDEQEGHEHAEHDGVDHEGHDHESEGHDHEAEGHEEHGHEGHADEFKLSADAAKRFGVQTQRLAPGEFHETVIVSGRIESAVSDQAVVSAPRAGVVSFARGVNPGMKVAAGQTIASVSPKGLAGGDPQRAAIATRDAARAEMRRIEPLYKEGIVSAKDYNEAKRILAEAEAAAGGAPAGAAAATATRGGALTQLLVRPGEYVELGQPIAVVSASSRLTLRADVPERYYNMLPTVATANFRPDYSESTLRLADLGGRLAGYPGSTPSQGGYIPVYFTFDNNGSVVPGSFAEVTLIGASRPSALTVPVEAVIEIQGNKYVYTREHDDSYIKRLVKTGRSDGLSIEVMSGLSEGMDVVVKGAGVVRMAETSKTALPAHTHNH